MSASTGPKVSVCVITYNHVQFIAQALESILNQETTFDFEVVIGDDYSTDGTTELIRSYQEQHPGKIRLLPRSSNLGMGKNLHETLNACKGEYVAFLEGDDYWTNPQKLQTQTDFLDQHPDCVMCHHPVDHIEWPHGNIIREFPPKRYRHQRPTQQALAMFNFIQTCSVLFRRDCLPALDEQFENLKLGDWPLFVLLAQRGWIGYVDRNMAHYRVHPSNTWNHRPPEYKVQAMDAMAWYLMQRVDRACKDLWKDTILALKFKELLLALRKGSIPRALRNIRQFVSCSWTLKRPLWLATRLWSYWNVYRS